MEQMQQTAGVPETLDSLAAQARLCVKMARINLLQLGRVLLAAKPLIGHGGWAEWVKSNTNMSVRTAEQYMQAYQQFGLDDEIAELGTSKILKLLPLPEDERRELLEKNDVSAMSARELDAAIKQARAEGKAEAQEEARETARREQQAEIEKLARASIEERALLEKALQEQGDAALKQIAQAKEAQQAAEARIEQLRDAQLDAERRIEEMRAAKADAERRAADAENREAEPPQSLLDELEDAKERARDSEAGAQHFAELAKKLSAEKVQAERELEALKADIAEQNDLLKEQQAALNRAQEELLNIQSAQARGDMEHAGNDGVTPEDFSAAVREFIGATCRLPQMQRTFAAMSAATREVYEDNLRTIESWLQAVRAAMNTVLVEVSCDV